MNQNVLINVKILIGIIIIKQKRFVHLIQIVIMYKINKVKTYNSYYQLKMNVYNHVNIININIQMKYILVLLDKTVKVLFHKLNNN